MLDDARKHTGWVLCQALTGLDCKKKGNRHGAQENTTGDQHFRCDR